MLFNSWDSLFRIVLVGTLAYVGTIVLMRLSGNRTLSKMNSFDLVITIAFGSTLSTVLTDSKVSLAEGLVAIGLLVGLQFVITWLSVRSRYVNAVIKTQPSLLVRDGEFLHEEMKTARVTEDEIFSVVRKHGVGSLKQVAAVVLETDGSMSVISTNASGALDTLHGVWQTKASQKASRS